MDYPQYENNEYNKNFLRKTFYQWQWKEMQNVGSIVRNYLIKTFLVSIFFCFFVSCKSTSQSFVKYYAYESKEKFSNGLPVQYYTLESRFDQQIIRFSNFETYEDAIVKIKGEKDNTWLIRFVIDIYDEEEPYKFTSSTHIKETFFRELYIVTKRKAFLRYDDINNMLSDETREELYKKYLNIYFWFPPEMKRVKNIDYSKFPKDIAIK